ncbi:hypothetical protein B0H19DRAFT_1202783 [Mycena capillaripes]|nr:hypothetical protein B0H19DRAFT_1202783 [Mycena capillaripes]
MLTRILVWVKTSVPTSSVLSKLCVGACLAAALHHDLSWTHHHQFSRRKCKAPTTSAAKIVSEVIQDDPKQASEW